MKGKYEECNGREEEPYGDRVTEGLWVVRFNRV